MSTLPARPPGAPRTARQTVLVVDDYPENCRLIYFYLRGDFDVITASTAEEALEILGSQVVDLIVMDINLKDGMNGIEATQEIRRRDETRDIPVLAISAYAYPDDRARFLEAGFDDYIAKPIFKDAMRKKVAAMLGRRRNPTWVTRRQQS